MYPVVVFDLASLRLRPNASRTALSVHTTSGELLAVVETLPDADWAEAAFCGFEQALAAGRVRRGTQMCRVGLYNPLSAQVVVGAHPDTRVFVPSAPVGVPTDGLLVTVGGEGLTLPDEVVVEHAPTFASTTRAWEMSSAQ